MEWLTTELKLLSQVYGTAPLPDIQREHFPHRTEYALQRKASHIGLSSKQIHKRSVSSDTLCELVKAGYKPTEIATITGLSRKGVYSAVRDRKDIPSDVYELLRQRPTPIERDILTCLPFRQCDVVESLLGSYSKAVILKQVKQMVDTGRLRTEKTYGGQLLYRDKHLH